MEILYKTQEFSLVSLIYTLFLHSVLAKNSHLTPVVYLHQTLQSCINILAHNPFGVGGNFCRQAFCWFDATFPPKDNLKSNRRHIDDTQWEKMLVAAVMVFATKATAVGLFLFIF